MVVAMKTHCRHGHDVRVCGRVNGGGCRDCARDNQRTYRQTENGKANRRRRVRRAAGVVDPPSENREGPCEACGRLAAPLHLDHDHATGAVRGWLCGPCNRALGLLQDSPERCRQLAAYMER